MLGSEGTEWNSGRQACLAPKQLSFRPADAGEHMYRDAPELLVSMSLSLGVVLRPHHTPASAHTFRASRWNFQVINSLLYPVSTYSLLKNLRAKDRHVFLSFPVTIILIQTLMYICATPPPFFCGVWN